MVTHMNRGGLETMLMNYYRNIDRDKVGECVVKELGKRLAAKEVRVLSVEDKKYNHLVLVTSSPLYKNLKVIVDVIDCYRKQTLFLEDKGSLAKDDIISLDEYYDEKGRKVVVRDYNKEI